MFRLLDQVQNQAGFGLRPAGAITPVNDTLAGLDVPDRTSARTGKPAA
jgi:hypothetical protein